MEFHNKKKYISFLKFKRNFQQYSLEKVRIYELLLHWLKSRLSRGQFLILSGMLVGCTAGLAGVLLKAVVHHIHELIVTKVHFEYQILFYIVFPFLGIVLTTITVLTIFKGQDRKGIGAVLYEIAQNSSMVARVKMYSQMVQSAITVGLGGSAGLESPMAVTGAAIGSNYAQTYKLGYKERTLLLAAGATAGIASAFNAPIAGIMFAFEILLTGVVFSDFIPLVVAAVCGSLLSRILLEDEVLFRFHARESFDYHNIPYYLILGLISGFYARYFIVISHYVEAYIKRLRISRIRISMLGGAALSLLCLLLPPLFGEGYTIIKGFADGHAQAILHNSFFRYFETGGWTLIVFLTLICLLKAFATSITIHSGGNGGNFAPSLFAGGTLGFLFAMFCIQLGFEQVPVSNLVLAGMAGVMSGALYAPLTAIFLIAESSSGYDLFIPLMIVSVMSYLMARWFSVIPPDFRALADAGKIFTQEHDKNLLYRLQTKDMIDKESETIQIGQSIADLQEIIKNGKKNIFAVIDDRKHLKGVLTLDDIRPMLFRSDLSEIKSIQQLMKAPIAIIDPNRPLPEVVKIFDDSGIWQLPVVNQDDEFIGFISKSTVLASYRKILQEYSS